MFRKCLMAFVVLGLIAGTANADLVARWTFTCGSAENVGGTAGSAADGSLEGGATIIEDNSGFPNYYGDTKGASKVAQLEGDFQYINCGGGGGGYGDLPGPITLMAWMQPDIDSWAMIPGEGENWARILCKGGGENDGFSLSRKERFGNVAITVMSTPGWDGLGGADPDIWDGNWHHVAGTWVPGQSGPEWYPAKAEIYIDGILSATGQRWGKDVLATNEWDVAIGGNHKEVVAGSGYNFWYGLIDDARIYDELLDGAAIAAAYAEGLIDDPCVPEPATIALLGLGGLALLRRKR